MRLVPLSEIIIPPDRQRQDFDAEKLHDLMTSIQTVGLLQPIVVRDSTEGPVLVAGERRIRAIKDISSLGGTYYYEASLSDPKVRSEVPEGQIPAINLGELTELEWSQAEYDENSARDNLTWQEQAAATVRLARLRGIQAENAGRPAPTVAEISLERRGSDEGSQHNKTKQELIVAKHFADPEIAGAKTLSDAFKTLVRREEVKKRTEHAARVGAVFTSATHQLYNTDSFTWLAQQEENQFDVILTDPPYGMGADEFNDAGGGAHAHSYEDSPDAFLSVLNLALPHFVRVAKPAAHLYWFCDLLWFEEIKKRLDASGWKCFRTPLIWHKPNAFRAPWPEHGPRRTYELILYAIKGQRPCNVLAGDVITVPTEPGTEGAQKPVELFKELLKRSARPGDTVGDFFCGKGVIFPAADSLKCKAVGVEKDPAEYILARERLDKLVKGELK